jgi:hypothetical protein
MKNLSAGRAAIVGAVLIGAVAIGTVAFAAGSHSSPPVQKIALSDSTTSTTTTVAIAPATTTTQAPVPTTVEAPTTTTTAAPVESTTTTVPVVSTTTTDPNALHLASGGGGGAEEARILAQGPLPMCDLTASWLPATGFVEGKYQVAQVGDRGGSQPGGSYCLDLPGQ